MKTIICWIFGHLEWRPSQVRDFAFICPTDPTTGDRWEVRICDRCELVYLHRGSKKNRG